MMQRFAEFVMRSRTHAIMLATIATLLPFFGWIGFVVMALVTLRKGAKEGAVIALWVALPTAVMAYLGWTGLSMKIVALNIFSTWLLAVVLRSTSSWSKVLEVAVAVATLGILITYMVFPDITQFWINYLTQKVSVLNAMSPQPLDATLLKQAVNNAAGMMTGLCAASSMFTALMNVFFGRWLQSVLYMPGGLRQELQTVVLSRFVPVAVVALLVMQMSNVSIASELLPTVMLALVLAGISLLHTMLRIKQVKRAGVYLGVYYIALMMLFLEIAGLTMIAAGADSFLRFRQRAQMNLLNDIKR